MRRKEGTDVWHFMESKVAVALDGGALGIDLRLQG